MKELTIEEKAKRYDEALERSKAVKKTYLNLGNISAAIVLESIFPELKESENERVRKAIHIYLDWLDGRKDYAPKGEYSIRDMIAWLEKQGEQKATIYHKFRVGDEIKTQKEESLTITKIDDEGYWSEDLFICDFNEECIWDLVEQKAAEWSEEDEKWLREAISIIKQYDIICRNEGDKCWTANTVIDWLKSLRPQN